MTQVMKVVFFGMMHHLISSGQLRTHCYQKKTNYNPS